MTHGCLCSDYVYGYVMGMILLCHSMWHHYVCIYHCRNYFLQPGQAVQTSAQSICLGSVLDVYGLSSCANHRTLWCLLAAPLFCTNNSRAMEQYALKNLNNCLNTNIYSYLETSGGQSSNLYLNVGHFFNTRVD